jgi:predicted dehydrogenase
MKIAVLGAGYWTQFQIPAWQSLGADVTAIWNRTYRKAVETARRFNIPSVYENIEDLFEAGGFDLCDIITGASAHMDNIRLCVEYGVPFVCQKPLAASFEDCAAVERWRREKRLWGAVHENFRFQPQFAVLKELLSRGRIGRISRAALQLKSPDRDIISKQPALRATDHMALRDMGSHLFDVTRFLFGEVNEVYSKAVTEYEDIGVDDSAVSVLACADGPVINCDLVHDFEYKAYIVGDRGRILLDKSNTIRVIDDGREEIIRPKIPERLHYIPEDDWQIHGGHVFSAITPGLESLMGAYLRGVPADTSVTDNLKTMRLVFAAIKSQDEDRAVRVDEIK